MNMNLLVFTNHSFQRYAERILVSDQIYREKLEKSISTDTAIVFGYTNDRV